jgi:hypothetical protein
MTASARMAKTIENHLCFWEISSRWQRRDRRQVLRNVPHTGLLPTIQEATRAAAEVRGPRALGRVAGKTTHVVLVTYHRAEKQHAF